MAGWLALMSRRILVPTFILTLVRFCGPSKNKISPSNEYTDSFKTFRWLVKGDLSGDMSYNFSDHVWNLRPSLSISYIQDHQKSYKDSNGILIPSQKVGLGQVRFGPNFSTRFVLDDGTIFEPHVSMDGICQFWK